MEEEENIGSVNYTIPAFFIKILDDSFELKQLIMVDYQDQFYFAQKYDENSKNTLFKSKTEINSYVNVSIEEYKDSFWIILTEDDWLELEYKDIKAIVDDYKLY